MPDLQMPLTRQTQTLLLHPKGTCARKHPWFSLVRVCQVPRPFMTNPFPPSPGQHFPRWVMLRLNPSYWPTVQERGCGKVLRKAGILCRTSASGEASAWCLQGEGCLCPLSKGAILFMPRMFKRAKPSQVHLPRCACPKFHRPTFPVRDLTGVGDSPGLQSQPLLEFSCSDNTEM